MCGITGYWGGARPDETTAANMACRIAHRGPDDAGVWIDDKAGLALAHRRLSIVDLSPAGHQPMLSPCDRFALVYNGEIYNHLDLRVALENEGGAFNWRGHSDTETLLAALSHWGVQKTLKRLNGMFAFAFWDIADRKLFLARDRMGEKPLYYGRNGDTFLFGSELKSLAAHPCWNAQLDRDSLTLFLRYSYVPTPRSIYKGIKKLPPAHFIVVSDEGREMVEPVCYWDISEVAARGVDESKSPEDLIDELDILLSDSIFRRMASDVPLGAFLSGGYDSTTVAALMQAQSDRPIQTFTIGFHEEGYDEAQHARAVADYLGTDHTEIYVTPAEAMEVVPSLPSIYDEPFADSSQIPTFLVSHLARQHVTVSLSGDGGDELFCGYNRYLLGHNLWSKLRWLPMPARQALAALFRNAPGHALDRAQYLLPRRHRVSSLADRLPKFADVLSHRDGHMFYRSLVSHFQEPATLVLGAREQETILNHLDVLSNSQDLRERMMLLDMLTYLPDDILAKVDRASMANSLEVRVPLLDHRLVEFAWRVPIDLKCRNGQGKWLMKRVLDRYVPRKIMDRPKMGFGVPIEHWLRGPLRDWAEALLDEKRLREEGLFDPAPLSKMWSEHLSGRRRWHYQLWDVLMFQAWKDEQGMII